jgi:hypothetical protein
LGIENRKPKKNSVFSSRQQLPKKIIKIIKKNYFLECPRERGNNFSARTAACVRTGQEGGERGEGGKEGVRSGRRIGAFAQMGAFYPQVTS